MDSTTSDTMCMTMMCDGETIRHPISNKLVHEKSEIGGEERSFFFSKSFVKGYKSSFRLFEGYFLTVPLEPEEVEQNHCDVFGYRIFFPPVYRMAKISQTYLEPHPQLEKKIIVHVIVAAGVFDYVEGSIVYLDKHRFRHVPFSIFSSGGDGTHHLTTVLPIPKKSDDEEENVLSKPINLEDTVTIFFPPFRSKEEIAIYANEFCKVRHLPLRIEFDEDRGKGSYILSGDDGDPIRIQRTFLYPNEETLQRGTKITFDRNLKSMGLCPPSHFDGELIVFSYNPLEPEENAEVTRISLKCFQTFGWHEHLNRELGGKVKIKYDESTRTFCFVNTTCLAKKIVMPYGVSTDVFGLKADQFELKLLPYQTVYGTGQRYYAPQLLKRYPGNVIVNRYSVESDDGLMTLQANIDKIYPAIPFAVSKNGDDEFYFRKPLYSDNRTSIFTKRQIDRSFDADFSNRRFLSVPLALFAHYPQVLCCTMVDLMSNKRIDCFLHLDETLSSYRLYHPRTIPLSFLCKSELMYFKTLEGDSVYLPPGAIRLFVKSP